MDTAKARDSIDRLAARSGGEGPQIIGVLTMDANGDIAVTVENGIELDVIELGIVARGRRTKIEIGSGLREPEVVEDEPVERERR